jgi:hypothetical protein
MRFATAPLSASSARERAPGSVCGIAQRESRFPRPEQRLRAHGSTVCCKRGAWLLSRFRFGGPNPADIRFRTTNSRAKHCRLARFESALRMSLPEAADCWTFGSEGVASERRAMLVERSTCWLKSYFALRYRPASPLHSSPREQLQCIGTEERAKAGLASRWMQRRYARRAALKSGTICRAGARVPHFPAPLSIRSPRSRDDERQRSDRDFEWKRTQADE